VVRFELAASRCLFLGEEGTSVTRLLDQEEAADCATRDGNWLQWRVSFQNYKAVRCVENKAWWKPSSVARTVVQSAEVWMGFSSQGSGANEV
jgi:hypothetical protein